VTQQTTEVRIHIASERAILEARQRGRELANDVGLGFAGLAIVATAISELARNILRYAGEGDVVVQAVEESGRRGVMIIASDTGPGIAVLDDAMRDGYSTSGGLGMGLPGVKRLMDDFEVCSRAGAGTRVVARKWKP
jgi:serine/threonine-protein kinase RsbT